MKMFTTLGLAGVFCAACATGQMYQTPDEVPDDYPNPWLQGEYLGEAEINGQQTAFGVQVVTRGDDEFRALIFPNGLPGMDDVDGEPADTLETVRDNDYLVFHGDGYSLRVAGGTMTAVNDDGDAFGVLERTVRESPTLGKEPPEGAVVLFDGTDVDMWEDGAEMREDGLLREGALSRDDFADAYIHLEFMNPYFTESRVNSGVYIMRRYEVQIYESFGYPNAQQNEAALYNERAPDINASLPPLQWQTFDIWFRAPRFDEDGEKTENVRITVKHNGVLVHDDVELEGGTGAGGSLEEVAAAQLYLQDHNAETLFRNVWLVEDLDYEGAITEIERD